MKMRGHGSFQMMKPWKIDTKIKKQKSMFVFLDKSIESAFHICLQNITFLTDFYIKINSFSLHCAIIT
ncbi:hypothetical protein ROSEINA2194_03331 [Roseburia inulinivorans DSM 16841]|uniref:Uncharacterized protein n=1 Tax=Roseburia inulinivorans DSM 16841 TaxID=622312 RepID=C0FX51_9FIRM|nr:hypothetical protein ROSEINA2194_03331 [Roseburia inulinivorans DSM 16841]